LETEKQNKTNQRIKKWTRYLLASFLFGSKSFLVRHSIEEFLREQHSLEWIMHAAFCSATKSGRAKYVVKM
jgi:hypothetical protein